MIIPSQFLHQYSEWWASRKQGALLSPVFTCLLLRICAHSAQSLSLASTLAIEAEMGEPLDVFAQRLHDSAEKLSRCMSPGRGGLQHIQQLFLAAAWYKSESRFVEGWHSLSAAIREAQEVGLHRDSPVKCCSDFDKEICRRVWCLLYVWDFKMAQWLDRPFLIDHRRCTSKPPNLKMDTDGDIPSPFTPIFLQYQICAKIAAKSDEERKNTVSVLSDVEKWQASTPRIYRLSDPDTSLDASRPQIRLQRAFFGAMGCMFKMGLLKHCLTKSELDQVEKSLRPVGIDACLDAMHAARDLYDVLYPDDKKTHILTCCAFETACILTSALAHHKDVKNEPFPRRQEALEAIRTGLSILQALRHETKMASTSYTILSGLASSILSPAPASKRQKTCFADPSFGGQRSSSASDSSGGRSGGSISNTDPNAPSASPVFSLDIPSSTTTPPDALAQGHSNYSFTDPFAAPQAIEPADFDLLSQVWDWESLNLDFDLDSFTNDGHAFQSSYPFSFEFSFEPETERIGDDDDGGGGGK